MPREPRGAREFECRRQAPLSWRMYVYLSILQRITTPQYFDSRFSNSHRNNRLMCLISFPSPEMRGSCCYGKLRLGWSSLTVSSLVLYLTGLFCNQTVALSTRNDAANNLRVQGPELCQTAQKRLCGTSLQRTCLIRRLRGELCGEPAWLPSDRTRIGSLLRGSGLNLAAASRHH